MEKSIFICFSEIIKKFCRKVENVPGKIPELIASITYIFTHLFMAFVHEPWFDESVAWQIARCVSIKDILFEIPHYEGHPPMWHLILAPFAKLGAPYELSLSIVSLIFAGTACCLIIYKSPFPRIIKFLLPFTYFFFYQYSVISRPYCIMMLAFVLLAIAYSKRNTKPGIYVVCLMLLCLSSAYGILMAGGLTIAWILEIWNRENIFAFIKKMLRDKRTLYLFVLLIFALLLIIGMMPREDTYATTSMSDYKNIGGFLRCLIYMLFALPAEVCMTNIYNDYQLLKTVAIPWPSLIVTGLIGILFWVIVFLWGKRKKTLLTLIVPYTFFAVFAAFVYVYTHHIGIGLLLFVFWFWISLESGNEDKKAVCEKIPSQIENVITGVLILFGSLAMVISLYWNVTTCIQDVLYSYATGKHEAQFIKEKGLDNYTIMVSWSVHYDENGEVEKMDVNHANCADNIAPYFDRNIFFNFNGGEDDVNYSTHKWADEKATEEIISKWQKTKPDVLYMYPDITLIYEDIDPYEYKLVYSEKNYNLWKGFVDYGDSKIYVHQDVVDELNLETLKNETYGRMSLYQ